MLAAAGFTGKSTNIWITVGLLFSILLLSPTFVVRDGWGAQQQPSDSPTAGENQDNSSGVTKGGDEPSGIKPEFTAVQYGNRTILLLASNWTVASTHGEITLVSSKPMKKVYSSDWWNITQQSPSKVTFSLLENVYRTSHFTIFSNTSEINYDYNMTVNSTSYSGKIVPSKLDHDYKFKKWSSGNENAATAFIPENWKADLQIVRPYKMMTGFVFFARDNENPNRMLYIFQPFVPMHILPSDKLCQEESAFCSSFGQTLISVDQVKDISFGNAPLAISNFKDPEQYFTQEILPILGRNLDSYKVVSSAMDKVAVKNNAGNNVSLVPALDVRYSFNSKDGDISGMAAVFTQNYTLPRNGGVGDSNSRGIGFWNGFVIGIESPKQEFPQTMKNALVALYTLKFEDKWVDNERKMLLENAQDVNGNNTVAIADLSKLIANKTMDDFNLFTRSGAAELLGHAGNDTKVAGFFDNSTGRDFDLPIYKEDLRHWFISKDGQELLGRFAGTAPPGYVQLESLYL